MAGILGSSYPLVDRRRPEDPFALRESGMVTVGGFLADVAALAAALPESGHVFNLCEDRYCFTVAFAAAVVRGQTNLLPPSRTTGIIQELAADYPDSYQLFDTEPVGDELQAVRVAANADGEIETSPPKIDGAHIAAIAFTSGSTGKPKGNAKTWGSLYVGTELAQARFLEGLYGTPTVVATVPPQHMYGLETTVLLALHGGAVMHGGRPFYPQDVAAALSETEAPRVLVTTPVHLRALVTAETSLPPISFSVSATAPLDAELAAAAEQLTGAPVREIYGFTEAGSIASRRRLDGDTWRLYQGLSLQWRQQTAWVAGGHLPEPVPLSDLIEPGGYDRFVLVGRSSDMVNIAGKRASLADLTQKLMAIDGVEDGVMVLPDDENATGTVRLAALVVAHELSERDIVEALRGQTDPVFLPRPIYKVNALPRNAASKLPRKEVMRLLNEIKSSRRGRSRQSA